MWMIFITAGVCIVIFNYISRRTRERRQDRQDKLREIRQNQLDLLLGKDKNKPTYES